MSWSLLFRFRVRNLTTLYGETVSFFGGCKRKEREGERGEVCSCQLRQGRNTKTNAEREATSEWATLVSRSLGPGVSPLAHCQLPILGLGRRQTARRPPPDSIAPYAGSADQNPMKRHIFHDTGINVKPQCRYRGAPRNETAGLYGGKQTARSVGS
ncbi:hypothetical protein LY78DRAFT_485886 [Colletotrichum sublineola]|nr:hypothetical protein LY78DRAFT_485886 [Colletotrichum sublineola]